MTNEEFLRLRQIYNKIEDLGMILWKLESIRGFGWFKILKEKMFYKNSYGGIGFEYELDKEDREFIKQYLKDKRLRLENEFEAFGNREAEEE